MNLCHCKSVQRVDSQVSHGIGCCAHVTAMPHSVEVEVDMWSSRPGSRWLQEKFSQNFLARECRGTKDGADGEADQVAAVRAMLQRHYSLLVPVFMFYSCSVSSVPFFMGLNEFTALLDDCQIPDNESQGVKRSDLDTVFIVCTRKVQLLKHGEHMRRRRATLWLRRVWLVHAAHG